MSPEADDIQRLAAEAVVRDTGVSIEQALDGLEFQDRARTVMDELDARLGDVSGGVWYDWSDGRCRLKIGVTTRADEGSTAPAKRLLENSGLADRTEFVKVVWTIQELEAAQERAGEVLESLPLPWGTGLQVSTNSITIHVRDDLDAEQLKVIETAVRAAGVSVRVLTDAGWGTLDSGRGQLPG